MKPTARVLTAAVLIAGSAWVACGGDDHDVCPNGCDLPGTTVVKWKFNNYPAVNFDSDTCSELNVSTVHVEMTGVEDPTVVQTLDKQCAEGQATFSGLPVQNYTIAVTPLDADGTSLVKNAATGMVAAAGENSTVTANVNVQFELWAQSYTGQFLYQLKWDGKTCATATPAITMQKVKLTVGGVVSTAMTSDSEKLDGTAFPCYTNSQPQSAMNIPWGPATLEVTGIDGSTNEAFKKTFDTFVGAGLFNPTLTFDVTPDAMPPDA
ncbi:MAG TPA: hypothetical protein VGM39_09010 [Kofleriaceae bacterium]